MSAFFNRSFSYESAKSDKCKAFFTAKEALAVLKKGNKPDADAIKAEKQNVNDKYKALEEDKAFMANVSMAPISMGVIVGVAAAVVVGALLAVFMFVPALAATAVSVLLLSLALNPIVMIAIAVGAALLLTGTTATLIKYFVDDPYNFGMSKKDFDKQLTTDKDAENPKTSEA